MKVALLVAAVLLALFLLDRLGLWMESRGWIYYRRRRGSSGTLGNAFLELQTMVDPGQCQVLEARRREEDEAAESGDPPEPGADRESG